MRTTIHNGLGLLGIFCALASMLESGLFAQTPSISLAGYGPTVNLTLTGEPGSVYSIESIGEAFPADAWADRTWVRAQAWGTVWTDPAPAPNQQFYRARSVGAPSDTNLMFIQPGTFTMGSPTGEPLRFSDETQHAVTISRGFWIGRFLVTQEEYLGVVGSNPSYFTTNNGFTFDLRRPVDQVSWSDATNYCALLTARELAQGRIPTHCAYRLPTESEWEYACRAGTTTAFYIGDILSSGDANFWGKYGYDASTGQVYNASGVYLQATTTVGSYQPNGWGLYDMIGNLWEWCLDWYGPYPAVPAIDPQGPTSGPSRVARGGDWGSFGRFCRSAQRSGSAPAPSSRKIGFRVVLAYNPS